jgi:hypothetical protein
VAQVNWQMALAQDKTTASFPGVDPG